VVEGGGDLYAMGRSERGSAWRVGIRSPKDPSRIDGMLEISDEAVATSGDYFRYFDYHHHRYHHIMDPSLAEPRLTQEHSVSVRAPRCITADVAATSVFGLDRAQADRLLARTAPGARIASVL
jgi:thiamine biosynthesis lipoprotein